MPKIVILKNQTASDIDFLTIGETLPASGQMDLSDYTAKSLRNDSTLTTGVNTGDIVVNDGTKDLDAQIGAEFIRNDTVNDADGFWYAKRRRFSVLWNQTGHGFVNGQIIRLDEDTGLATLALADSHANSATTAIVSEVVDADSFYAGLSGAVVENIDATAVTGGLPMTVGGAYFLSTTVPGQITPNPPQGIGEIVKLVGVAISTNAMTSFAYAGYENETGVTTAELTKMKSGGSIVRHPNTFQRSVISMTVNDPSTLTSSNGDRYVVGTTPVGVWAGKANSIVEYVSSTSTWYEVIPQTGFFLLSEDSFNLYYFDGLVWVNASLLASGSDLASLTLGFTTTFALPLTMTDTVWDITHLQNNTTIIQHDVVNQERVLIKETGLYFINFSVSFDADPGEEQISAQVVRNGATVVPGSFRLASEDDEINDLSNAFTAELTAGDYVTLQSMATGAGNTCHNSTNFNITRARGTQGTPGPTGPAGTEVELPVVQARRTTALNGVPLSWTDFDFDTTDVENNTATIEHLAPATPDSVRVKDSGMYEISYHLVCDDEVQGRIRINNSTVVPGSTQIAGDPNDVNDVFVVNHNTVFVALNANDVITLQIRATTTFENIVTDALLLVKKLKGTKGADGAPGAGSTILVQDEGTNVLNTPHDTLDFVGAGVTVTDAGSGKSTVTIPGSSFTSPNYLHRHNGAVTQTLSASFITINIGSNIRTDGIYSVASNKVTINASGWYKITYDMGTDATSGTRSVAESRLELDGVAVPGSLAYTYNRTSSAGAGKQTGSATVLVQVTAGQIIRLRSRESNGAIITLANSCRLTIEQLL